ncbi:hypothetical protein [Dactylosporangium sp. CA-233914]|uniref:hypothetical protein n=1 Tax=Dactylosporangium sp. CA-233914 TaxID=3239934 RepID=UPI003D8E052A
MIEVDAGEYAKLLHAYGRATDTPGHLAALAGGDAAARQAAFSHLWGAIIHQGTPWTATAPVAVVVAGLVGDPRLAAGDRANLLNFLAAVAEAGRSFGGDLGQLAPPDGYDVDAALAEVLADPDDEDLAGIYGDEVLGNAVYARAIQDCIDVVPTVLAAAIAALGDPQPEVRAAAAHAIGASCPPGRAAEVIEQIDAAAGRAGVDARAALVLAIGDLGGAPRAYLRDPHPGVRACAALAPALAGDPAATDEILAALRDPAATDDWFTHRPPQIPMRIRFSLVAAAIARVEDPERLLPAALAIAPVAHIHTARSDWGALLLAIPDGPARQRYLEALRQNEDLWDPRNGSVALIFKQAGVPYDAPRR